MRKKFASEQLEDVDAGGARLIDKKRTKWTPIDDSVNVILSILIKKCRICGCTDEHACPGGCHWVEDDLCSRCDEAIEAVARWKIGNLEKLEHQVDAGAAHGDPLELEHQVDAGAGELGGEDLELEHQVDAGAGELGGEDLELEHQVDAGAGELGGEDLELEHQVDAGAGELGGEDLELEHREEDERGHPWVWLSW
jgi:hypothetical protein